MKLKPILIISVLLATIAGVTLDHFSRNDKSRASNVYIPELYLPKAAGPDVDILFKNKIPESKKKKLNSEKDIKVYKFKDKKMTMGDFKKLADLFGMEGNPVKEKVKSEAQLLLQDGGKQLILDPVAGFWSFGDNEKLFLSAEASDTISDSLARDTATDFLQKNNLLPEDFKFQAVTVVSEEIEPSTPPRIVHKTVNFYRYISDQPVYGVSRILVDISNEGEIIGVSNYYKEITEFSKQPVKSIEEAFNNANQKKGMITTDDPEIESADITDVDIVYYEDPGSISEQPYLQPVYVFEAEGISKGKVKKFENIVPALKNTKVFPKNSKSEQLPESFGRSKFGKKNK